MAVSDQFAADPYEVYESALYTRWYGDNMWLFVSAQSFTAEFLATFKEFPPVVGSSLSMDKVLQSLLTPNRNESGYYVK